MSQALIAAKSVADREQDLALLFEGQTFDNPIGVSFPGARFNYDVRRVLAG